MTYDIEAIKKKISQLSTPKTSSKGKKDREKLNWFKPPMGSVEVRFLPYDDGNGQPFQQIDYYDSRKLSARRFVAPVQWNMPDPIASLMAELTKDRQNDATWNLMRHLRLKESHYAPLLVRGKESLGVQIWEMGPKVLNQIYAILAHPDYQEEYLFDPEKGYDFTITTTSSGNKVSFNGKEYDVKNYDIQPRRKPSVLAKTEKERKAILDTVPDLQAYFRNFVMGEEKLKEIVVGFLQSKANSEAAVVVSSEDEDSSSDSNTDSDATSKIDDAFNDL